MINARLTWRAWAPRHKMYVEGFPVKKNSDWFIVDETAHKFPINSETLSQTTGREDRYGEPIFENDIVKIAGYTGTYKVRYNPDICSFEMFSMEHPDDDMKVRDFCILKIEEIEKVWKEAAE